MPLMGIDWLRGVRYEIVPRAPLGGLRPKSRVCQDLSRGVDEVHGRRG